MDIFDDLKMGEILMRKHDWKHDWSFRRNAYSNVYERIYYNIDTEHFIEVSFINKETSINMVKISGSKVDIIFCKKITLYSKYFFLYIKLKHIRISLIRSLKKERDLIQKLKLKDMIQMESDKEKRAYDSAMKKIPKSFLRESVINDILEINK
tara:strand:- start:80219 stop:80677 length:459 start_codon:yes stop_codon:yes gene_type:complete